jgi:hypothetical protein
MPDLTRERTAALAPGVSMSSAVASGSAFDELSRIVSRRLRSRLLGLRQSLNPLLLEQQRLLTEAMGKGDGCEAALSALLSAEERLIHTLSARYDALDAAVRESEIPFVEIDGAGCISYANDAFARHVAQPIGRDFASLFGVRAKHVTQALALGGNTSLRLELYENGLPTSFRAEIGPLRDLDDARASYCLLLSLRAEELTRETAQRSNHVQTAKSDTVPSDC